MINCEKYLEMDNNPYAFRKQQKIPSPVGFASLYLPLSLSLDTDRGYSRDKSRQLSGS